MQSSVSFALFRPFLLLILGIILSAHLSYGQEPTFILKDSIKIKEIKPKSNRYFDPDRAALLSAVVPGLGQIYNRQYWKVPFIYAGIGTLYWFFQTRNNEYRNIINSRNRLLNPNSGVYVEEKYWERVEGLVASNGVPNVLNRLDNAERGARRNRDLTIVLTGAAYGIIIAEAYVDAHLKAFKISKDLSFKTKPSLEPTQFGGPAYGIGFNLSLK